MEKKERAEEILAVAKMVKDTYLKHGNPVGLSDKDFKDYLGPLAKELNLPSKGETLFYAGMYSYMGYSEVALMMEYTIASAGLSMLDMLKWLDFASKFGFKKNLLGISRLVTSRWIGAIASRFVVPKEVMEKLKAIVGQTEERQQYYLDKIKKGVQLLKDSGFSIAYMGPEEPDYGVGLHTFGFLEDFQSLAKKNYEKFKELGVKKIITMDPIAATAFKIFYPEVVEGFDIEVYHITQVLKPQEPPKEKKGKVVYQDPCFLVRYLAAINEPRALMESAGYQVIDPPEARDKTRCDGGAIEYQ
ncbi:MAG: hypothetical protein DRJ31_11045, partial [Candidatus Methanomethylicota archaeon]